jgi:hypothetical protein
MLVDFVQTAIFLKIPPFTVISRNSVAGRFLALKRQKKKGYFVALPFLLCLNRDYHVICLVQLRIHVTKQK